MNKEINRALNALRLEVDGDIVNSIWDIVEKATSSVNMEDYQAGVTHVYHNGVLQGELHLVPREDGPIVVYVDIEKPWDEEDEKDN